MTHKSLSLIGLFAVFASFILLVGCTKVIAAEQLQERGGLYYQVNASNPFTGTAQAFHLNGRKKSESNYVDGKRHGLLILWYENGQKRSEGNYVDDKRHGLVTVWSESGQKQGEINYVDGKLQ